MVKRRRSNVSRARLRARRARTAVTLLASALVGLGFWAWPHPSAAAQARGNGEVLRQLVARYVADHHGEPCRDLGSLVAAARTDGYDVRVRNPYSNVFASFDDPAIARPLSLYHGSLEEAGVVFYRCEGAPSRANWLIQVATPEGAHRDAALLVVASSAH